MRGGIKEVIKNFFLIFGLFLFFIFAFFLYRIIPINPLYSKSLSILFLSATLWVTNVISPAVTGILIIALTPLFNILTPEKTFSAFGNRAIFFLLSVFIMASSILKTGLAKKISFYFLKAFSKNSFFLLLGIFTISFFLSLIMPEHAVAAILFPFLLSISHNIKSKKFNKLIFLTMAWGAVSGGIGTPLGGARAPFAIGLYQETFKKSITFFDWTKYSFPVAFIFYIFGIFYIYLLSKGINEKIEIKENFERVLFLKEKETLLIYFFALFLWVFFSHKIDMAVTGLLASFFLFVLKVINWKDAQHYINWGIILMYGGAIVLGSSIYESGTANYISNIFLFNLKDNPILLFFILVLITLVLTEFMSNISACAIMLPLSYGFSDVFEPFFITLFIAISSGLPFLLPIGTPANAIAFSSGRYSVFDAFKYSIPFFFIAPFVMYFFYEFIWH